MKPQLLLTVVVLLSMMGCVSEPSTGFSAENLAVVIEEEESSENGVIVPPNMLDLDDSITSPSLSSTPCRCEWEIWEENGMVCLGEVCSDSCDLARACRLPADVCQPM